MTLLITTPYNYREQSPQMESNTMESLTEPDKAMSIREMLIRHSRGMPLYSTAGEPVYLGEEYDLPDVEQMDLSEIQELREKFNERVKQLKKQDAERQEKEKEEKYRKKFETESGKQQRPEAKSEGAASQAATSVGQQDD